MTEISSHLVKTLREKTGAGMMDCKKALEAVAGELEEAVDWLRKKGLSAAAKKSGRVAAEGLIGVTSHGTKGAMLEVNAETDFVARNEHFQKFVTTTLNLALENEGDLESLKKLKYPGTDRSVEEELSHLIATIGENMTLRRLAKLSTSQGVVCHYIHTQVAPELGRIGVLVALESSSREKEKLQELGMGLAMHIAAARPEALKIEDVSKEAVERERAIFKEQSLASGKSEDVVEKMVEGRIRKYLEEVVLLEQVYMIDGKTKVSKVVEELSKTLETPVSLIAFERFALGEGIEKKTTDFAAEVAEQLASK